MIQHLAVQLLIEHVFFFAVHPYGRLFATYMDRHRTNISGTLDET